VTSSSEQQGAQVLVRPDGVSIAWELHDVRDRADRPARAGDAGRPAVLLVHGFASSRSGNWVRTRWVEPLQEAGYRVVTLDLRGHGESAKPRALAAYALPRLRGDLLAVLDAAGVDGPAHVVGYSLGARLAWDLALRHPQRVRSLVIGGVPATGSFAGFDLPAALAALDGVPDGATASIAVAPTDGAPSEAAPDGAGRGSAETARYVRMARTVPGNDPHALLRLAEAVRRHPFVPEARVPSHPILFVTGADDALAPAVRDLAARIPHAEALELPGRDHVSAVTSRVFKQAAVEFLRGHGPGGC
jgi:pimeloyl-ACP methyl ester carboxylesterase